MTHNILATFDARHKANNTNNAAIAPINQIIAVSPGAAPVHLVSTYALVPFAH